MQIYEDLQTLDDNALVENVKTKQCSESLDILRKRHQALAFDIYKKYSPKLIASGLSVYDLSDDMPYVIYRAAEKFDPSKCAKFSTWLGNNIKYQCLTEMGKNSIFVNMDDEEINNVSIPEESSKSNETMDFIFTILDSLHDKRIAEVFRVRYLSAGPEKVPWSKVANVLKMSPQTALNLHQKGLKILKGKMDSLVVSDLV